MAAEPGAAYCPACGSERTAAKGRRLNLLRTVAIRRCLGCGRRYSAAPLAGMTYPPRVVMEAVVLYHLGRSVDEIATALRRHRRIDVGRSTVYAWLAATRDLCTIRRLGIRAIAARRGPILRTVVLRHPQVYRFSVHLPKLDLALARAEHRDLAPLRDYLCDIAHDRPDDLFLAARRASEAGGTVDTSGLAVERKTNHACRLAALALSAPETNRERHVAVQRFMLACDSATVASEVPVWLAAGEAAGAPIVGHIDLVQVRNGFVHLLDFKPEADRERNAAGQLATYAAAIARRTGIAVERMRCAWFDENCYFEFNFVGTPHRDAGI